MTIHWKAVEQYFTVVLFVNTLTPSVKPWVMEIFLTFDSMDRTLKCDHSLKALKAVVGKKGTNPLVPKTKSKSVDSRMVAVQKSDSLLSVLGKATEVPMLKRSKYQTQSPVCYKGTANIIAHRACSWFTGVK